MPPAPAAENGAEHSQPPPPPGGGGGGRESEALGALPAIGDTVTGE